MASQNGATKGKKTVLHFTAGLIAPEGEKEDPHCSITGMIQVTDGIPTSQPAHLKHRDYEDAKPCWWPVITVPSKKVLSYGPAYAGEEFCKTDLHEKRIEPGGVFSITRPDGTVAKYEIAKVEDLAG